MLKLSEAVSLGMHAMAALAESPERTVSVGVLAEKLHASAHHLSKVMQRLVKAGLLRSVRGPKGGFSFIRDAKDVTLLDVYQAVEGPFNPGDCLLSKKICSGNTCICGELIRDTNRKVYRHMKEMRLSDLAGVM